MAGRPLKRARALAENEGITVEEALQRIEAGADERGNGTWVSFKDMTPSERRDAQENGRATQRRRKEQLRLAEEQAMLEAHREHTLEIIETRIEIMRSLRAKGVVLELDENGEPTGDRYFDATKLDKDERKDLLSVLEQVDKRGWGQYKGQVQVSGNVSVQHEMDATHQRVLAASARWRDDDEDGDSLEAEDVEVLGEEE